LIHAQAEGRTGVASWLLITHCITGYARTTISSPDFREKDRGWLFYGRMFVAAVPIFI
jgi:hypothetical protein